MKKHIENIHICNFCDSVSKTEINKKRHMRDKHDKTTSSTSPKTKKRKDRDQGSIRAASQQVVTAGDLHGSQVMPGDPSQVVAGPRPGDQKVAVVHQGMAGQGPDQQEVVAGQQKEVTAPGQSLLQQELVARQDPDLQLVVARQVHGQQEVVARQELGQQEVVARPGLEQKEVVPKPGPGQTDGETRQELGLQVAPEPISQVDGQRLAQLEVVAIQGPRLQEEMPKTDEMFLADEERWENMKSEKEHKNDEVNNKLTELEVKYHRLLKAKEASDIRQIELLDKNAALQCSNDSKSIEIAALKDELKKTMDNPNPNKNATIVETSPSDEEVLRRNKTKGHTRTNPGAQAVPKPVQETHSCNVCKEVFESEEALQVHIIIHKEHCEKCPFKTDTKEQITKHMRLHHKELTEIKCSFCPATFIDKKNIFAHRKKYHYSYKACINIDNCSFNEQDLCSYNHNPITSEYICFQCGYEFDVLNDLMVHKKNVHKKELCKKFQTGRCTKNPCWYTHELMTQPTPTPTQPTQPTTQQTQGFWQTQPNQVPPAWNRPQQTLTQQNPTIQRDPMMNQIIQMMKHQQIQISQMNHALQVLASTESTESV